MYFTSGDCLLIYKLNGTLLLEKSLEGKHADMPYVYRFSYADMRIGLTDAKERKMWFADDGWCRVERIPDCRRLSLFHCFCGGWRVLSFCGSG